jgi:DNA-directed RNA polymerase subunit RPC12/RpoP
MSQKILHEPFQKGYLSYAPFQFKYTYKCTDCGVEFTKNSGNGKRCKDCQRKYKLRYHRSYYKRNPKKKEQHNLNRRNARKERKESKEL